MRKYTNKLPDEPGYYWYIGCEFSTDLIPVILYLSENSWYKWLEFNSPLDNHVVSIHCLHGQWSKRLQP